MSDLYITDGAFWLTCLAVAVAFLRLGRGAGRYAGVAALLAAAAMMVVPSGSVLSFGVSLLAVGAVYAVRPYASAVPLLALPLLSPFARYLNAVVGFEWRLGLSAVAGRAFEAMGREVTVRGSEIVLDGRAYGVDAACTGLHMLLSGLALALLLVAVSEWRVGRTLRWWVVSGVLATAGGLVLGSNLARILVLVDRGWGAEHALHGVTGLVCFGAYVSVPLLAGMTWLVRQEWALRAERDVGVSHLRQRWRLAVPLALSAALLAWGIRSGAFAKTQNAALDVTPAVAAALHHQRPEARAHGVAAYRFTDAIVFRKPIGAFYHAEHSPLICWRGSGYEIVGVARRAAPDGVGELYVGTLHRGGEELRTAWWMSNGARNTIRQVAWRADMAGGAAAYALVNVTAADEAALACWVEELWATPAEHVTVAAAPAATPAPRARAASPPR